MLRECCTFIAFSTSSGTEGSLLDVAGHVITLCIDGITQGHYNGGHQFAC